jgi:cysteine desulfurase
MSKRDKAPPPASAPEADETPLVYADANATTMMPQTVIDAINLWFNRGNPSAEYAAAKDAKKMMAAFRRLIAAECGFELEGPDAYAVIYTSGASESNCFIATSAARSYAALTGKLPHIITSSTEHKSLLACCQRMAKERMIMLTVLPVGGAGPSLGRVDPNALRRAIRPNTCLVSIMAANNETGVINDIKALGAVCRDTRIPFHTDAVQLFGKAPFRPLASNVAAFSASFHKLHGPPGVGLLVLRKSLIEGYDLCPQICGSQNDGMRGGTENLPGIAGSFAAFKLTTTDLADKMRRVKAIREAVKAAIGRNLPVFYLADHPGDAAPSPDGGITPGAAGLAGTAEARRAIAAAEAGGKPAVFWIAPTPTEDGAQVLPNTILLSVRRPHFCNKAARAALEAKGVICSVGSACNTKEALAGTASSVVHAMGVPAALHPGVLRISFNDDVTTTDAQKLVGAFLRVVTSKDCLESAAAAAAK